MAKLYLNPNVKKGHINKEIYGHFSEHLGRCIYEGIYVGEDSPIPNEKGIRKDVAAALREMKIPVLRWPGGCFADEYHWKDGIGPKETRKKMINTHWGGVVEDNSFGTHEFMELCRQLECEPYINANLGSGTVQEMSEWVEYMTFDGLSPMAALREQNGSREPWKVKYWGVGNENWGCGGNMTPEYYANEYRRYSTYCRNYGSNKLYKIACGANAADYEWTEQVMKIAHRFMDGLSLHYYTVPTGNWSEKGKAFPFKDTDWYQTLHKTLFMDELVTKNDRIMSKYDPQKRIGLLVDEWGTWYDVEEGTNPGFLYQQNTMRDALAAGINLNIFNKHCDRVKMANIAQMVNVLQAVILTEGEKMLLTPTWHVFHMYKEHQDADLIESLVTTELIGLEEEYMVPCLQESASVDKDGKVHVTINNLSLTNSYEVDTILTDAGVREFSGRILHGAMDDHNTFEDSERVKSHELKDVHRTEKGISFTIPPCSVLALELILA